MKYLMTAIAATSLVAMPALAGEPIEVVADAPEPQAIVYHGDLNLMSSAGYASFKGRIKEAARQICLPYNPDPVRIWVRQTGCYKSATKDGFAQASALRDAGLRGEVVVGAITITAR
ncbi:UrcA family protein [Sphingomicrobium arenosum]|uniref:UrcA family protein n=1 Tax=Sphingomicrobium arenosum TaxID=2233861 RepID=UPI00223FECD3|nr:UrcA family protein [Sphingomicrobium arenosum]